MNSDRSFEGVSCEQTPHSRPRTRTHSVPEAAAARHAAGHGDPRRHGAAGPACVGTIVRTRLLTPAAVQRHAGGLHAWVFKGRWHYLEHDWVAEEGSYIFEPPGETHTLVVPDGCTEMITLFQVTGSLMYVDPQGVST